MSYLILDTSTENLLLALFSMQGTDQKIFPHENALSKLLLPEIQTLLEKNSLTPRQLEGIALGIGPGSYTGTRVGAAVGKSLAYALSLPLKVFSSPLAFLPKEEGEFAFVIAARSGAFFVLKGSAYATSLVQKSISLVSPEELPALLSDIDFIVSATSSEIFPKKPLFTPRPNLHALFHFIDKAAPISPEKADLLYLHTPS